MYRMTNKDFDSTSSHYDFESGLCFSSGEECCYDLVVVGGGIIGMASAREVKLRWPHLSVAVLEKEPEVAMHQTGHNSGVIHAGIYYKPGSLRAKLCVEGMKLTYEFCDKYNIPYRKVGKLIVATNKTEVERLMDLFDRGTKNGVPDLRLIDGSQIRDYEPYCKVWFYFLERFLVYFDGLSTFSYKGD